MVDYDAGPSPRVPYRATSTPPSMHLRLHSPPPTIRSSSRPGTPRDSYPESPTSPMRPRTGFVKPPPFVLGGQGAPKRRLPRVLRSPRRLVWTLLVLGLLWCIAKVVVLSRSGEESWIEESLRVGRILWNGGEYKTGDGLCRFVSPLDAYQRDLERLRALHPRSGSSSHGNTSSINHSKLYAHEQHHHTYSPTGHLIVSDDPDAPHPIPLLLDLGEKRWEELLSRQSRTLEEAVREYTRRYGRQPPRGFDAWWDFAMQHNLVLPDEYDRINLDLAPFLALPKGELKRRMELVDHMAETFTLVVENGTVEIEIKDDGGLEWGGTLPRARDTANLISAFSQHLPDMRATFSIFDQPQIYISWARRGSLVDLGLRGEHTTHLEETDNAQVKLSRSCAPDSNYRKNESFSEGKSFIYDSLEAGDLCQNPYLIPIHGLTIEPHTPHSHPRPHTQLLPLFSLAKTSINSDILITPLDQFYDRPGKDPKWEDKTSSKLAWRGSPTGISMMSADLPWRQAHRIRLHNYANNRSSSPLNFIVPDLGQDEFFYEDEEADDGGEGEGVFEDEGGRVGDVHVPPHRHEHEGEDDGPLHFMEEELSTWEAMEFFYDMKLAGDPIQCKEEDNTCWDLQEEIEWAPHMPGEELNKNKFLLDIDGNGWSGRFRKLMSTNSVVVKMTMFTEWFQPHLIPWFMYIPAKLDFSDLPDIMAFFRGTPAHPELAFDETAKALARNGQCFVQRMFRMEDLQAYMMRLFLEYARMAADEGVDMDFYLDETEWIDDETDDTAVPEQEGSHEEGLEEQDVTVVETPGLLEGAGQSLEGGDELAEHEEERMEQNMGEPLEGNRDLEDEPESLEEEVAMEQVPWAEPDLLEEREVDGELESA
ncbi:hypothetical protein IAT38_005166 [Cryptococcus sp. DSM 104549]